MIIFGVIPTCLFVSPINVLIGLEKRIHHITRTIAYLWFLSFSHWDSSCQLIQC